MRMGSKGIGIGLTVLVCILSMVVMTACTKEEGGSAGKVVFTTGVAENEVFRIGNEICTKEELMVYLTATQNRYESVFGSEIWNVSNQGTTFKDSVKETVLARIAQVKTMFSMAKERGIALSEQEQMQVENASNKYFNSLSEVEKELLGVSLDTITELYREYAMAEKVYRTIIKDINPEISDDEARIITVQRILIKTHSVDEEGNRTAYSVSERQSAYAEAVEVRSKAAQEGQDFEQLASKYSDDKVITVSFGKGEAEQSVETAVFQLETNQISQIVETEDGYCIYKCITTFNREETDANKIKIVEQRREDAFGQEYDGYVATLKKQLNEELWEALTMIHDSRVTTSDFFEVYEEFVLVEPFEFIETEVE